MISLRKVIDWIFMYEFHNNVKQFRKEKGLSQEQLAALVGISRNSVSSIETGQYCPTAYTAALLCQVLECTFADLFYFIPEININQRTK